VGLDDAARQAVVEQRVALAAGDRGGDGLGGVEPGGDVGDLLAQRLEAVEHCLLAPKGVPHTYRVESREGARWLVITTRGDFERFVHALSRPAERPELPTSQGPPTPEQADALAAAAREHGIELVGPPLD